MRDLGVDVRPVDRHCLYPRGGYCGWRLVARDRTGAARAIEHIGRFSWRTADVAEFGAATTPILGSVSMIHWIDDCRTYVM